MKDHKRLHVQSIKDVIDHSLIKQNPSFLHAGCKRLIEEVDDLMEVLTYISTLHCYCGTNGDRLNCAVCVAFNTVNGKPREHKEPGEG